MNQMARMVLCLAMVLLMAGAANSCDQHPAKSVSMTANEAAAQAAELTGQLMQCWGQEYVQTPAGQPDILAAYQCTPGAGQTTPLVVCYQGYCKQVRWTGQICFPPRKD